MISTRHYIIALLTALFIHVALFFLFTYSLAGSAAGKGELGIELELGMLGELGSATETLPGEAAKEQTIEEQTIEKPAEAVQKVIQEPSSEPATEQVTEQLVTEALEPVVEESLASVSSPEQKADIKVEQRNKEKPPTAVTKSVTPAQKVPSESAVAPQQTENTVAKQKFSTGTANALTSGGTPGVQRDYYALITAKLAKYKRYPQYARRKGQEGTVLLSFTVLSSGLVQDSSIKQSSGYKPLDRAVKKMLKEASPLPPFPAQLSLPEMIITIPIVFKLNQE